MRGIFEGWIWKWERQEMDEEREESPHLEGIPRIRGTTHVCAVYDTGCDSSVH